MAKAIKKAIAKKVEAPKVAPTEQEIIEVSQEEVKKALKALMTNNEKKAASLLEELYEAHEAYNAEFFFGELNMPFITFEKMDNRTLGNYTHGEDAMGIENHIRFNVNFIALNPMSRVLETLRHEMIHQWQDEVLYAKDGKELKAVELVVFDENGKLDTVPGIQKKRPKDWHNADFKEMAKVVGILAQGAKCHGNPANMPTAQSYNRKFACGCIASNGYPMTVWSTREVKAVCQVCNRPYKELLKGGGTIEVTMSHVEKPNTDAVFDAMKDKFKNFDRFESKRKKDDFLEALELGSEGSLSEMEQGIYQKGHNMYDLGYHYWVAYNVAEEIHPDDIHDVEDYVTEADQELVDDVIEMALPKKKSKKRASEDGTEKKNGKIVKFPTPEPEVEEPKGEPEVETVERTYSDKNPQDIIDLYNELGTTRKVAERLGISQPTVMARKKKFGIDFKAGTFTTDEL